MRSVTDDKKMPKYHTLGVCQPPDRVTFVYPLSNLFLSISGFPLVWPAMHVDRVCCSSDNSSRVHRRILIFMKLPWQSVSYHLV